MSESAIHSLGDVDDPEADHLACLTGAIHHVGLPWTEAIAEALAQRALRYLDRGTGMLAPHYLSLGSSTPTQRPLAQYLLDSQPRFLGHAFIRAMVCAYVDAGHLELEVSRKFEFTLGTRQESISCHPFEAAIAKGNWSMVEICIEHCSRLPAAPSSAWREHDSSIFTFDDLVDRISSRPAMTEKIMKDVTRALRHQEARDIARGMVAVIDRARDATTSAAPAHRLRSKL